MASTNAPRNGAYIVCEIIVPSRCWYSVCGMTTRSPSEERKTQKLTEKTGNRVLKEMARRSFTTEYLMIVQSYSLL